MELDIRTTPALAEFAGKLVMVTTNASHELVVYELAGSVLTPVEQRPWRFVTTIIDPDGNVQRTLWAPSAARFDRPWTASPAPSGQTLLRVLYVASFAGGEPLLYADSATGAIPSTWRIAALGTGEGPAAGLPSTLVWDARPSLTGRRLWPDLRVWARRGTRCLSSADCGGSSCDVALRRCREGSSLTYSGRSDWLPLSRGADPAVGADYDDAPAVNFYMCEYLDWAGRSAAQGGAGFMAVVESSLPNDPYRAVPLSWQPTGCGVTAACRCGAAPVYEEPSASGWALLAAPNPSTDRTDRPHAYEAREATCP